MLVVLSVIAAIAYGIADFAGGLASRYKSATSVLVYSYPVGAVLMLAMLPLFPGPLSGRTALFGVLGRACGLTGVVLLYSLMTVAPMNVVSPVTAVLAAVVPVVVGVATGERPHALAWFGIALGLVAVVLVSRTTEDHPQGKVSTRVIALAVVSGVGFGGYFVFLARADSDSGLWPVVISRIAAAVLIMPLALRFRAITTLPRRALALAVVAGALDALANMLFLLASRHGYLALASVITSLYPAATVVLAVTVLHEHTGRMQRVGLGLAAAAIVFATR